MFVVYMYHDQQSRGSVREKEEGDRVTNVGMASSLPAEHPFRSPAKPHVRESEFVPPGRRIYLCACEPRCLEPQRKFEANPCAPSYLFEYHVYLVQCTETSKHCGVREANINWQLVVCVDLSRTRLKERSTEKTWTGREHINFQSVALTSVACQALQFPRIFIYSGLLAKFFPRASTADD